MNNIELENFRRVSMLDLGYEDLKEILWANTELMNNVKEVFKSVKTCQLKEDINFMSDIIIDFGNIDLLRIDKSDFRIVDSVEDDENKILYSDKKFIETFLNDDNLEKLLEFDKHYDFFRAFERYALTWFKKEYFTIDLNKNIDLVILIEELRDDMLEDLCDLIKNQVRTSLNNDDFVSFFVDTYIYECMDRRKVFLVENETNMLLELKSYC